MIAGGAPRGPLQGVLAAALTPLDDEGRTLDLDAVTPLVDFYVRSGMAGLFVAGTTGESYLLSLAERTRLVEGFVAAAAGRFPIVAHAGSLGTADTVALAEHAAAAGAACVAVAPPPFFALDDEALEAHFLAVAHACAPLPFYLYEIRQRTGYSIPVRVVQAVREQAANMVGMKVSDPTLEELERYLLPGLDVLVGAEPLIGAGLERGAVGAVSGLAGALPGHVADAVAQPAGRAIGLGAMRAGLERFPFHAAGKLTVIAQGVAIKPWVRGPLRQLTPAERTELEDWLASGVLASVASGVG
jgi:dihydrodipicolinate synthase/N-acetylneuraminate lyase